MTEYPIFDTCGGLLVSLERLEGGSLEDSEALSAFARSVVVVRWGQQVLFGLHVLRQQWELPGGAVEPGESAHEAAIRELAEETGIRVDKVALVARAEFMFESEPTVHRAAVLSVVLESVPDLVESDELQSFMWWDPTTDLLRGLCLLDAEVARRCLAH